MAVKITVIGCSPAWPNPGGAHSGYLLEADGGGCSLDCGPGVLSRLRELEAWPRVDAIAITHFHLDHWGDLVPWVWGAMYRARRRRSPTARALGARRRPRRPRAVRRAARLPGHVRPGVRRSHEYTRTEPFAGAGLRGDRRAGSALHARDVRFPRRRRTASTIAYSGDAGRASAWPSSRADADLFVCEATLAARREDDGLPRGHLERRRGARGGVASRHAKRLLLTHRPAELPVPDGRRARLRRARARALGTRLRRPASHARFPRSPAGRHRSRPSSRQPEPRRRSAASGCSLRGRGRRSAASADAAAPGSRRSRSARTRAICCCSSAGSIFERGIVSSSATGER